MITVKLSTSFPELPLLRQTPGWNGTWGEVQFYVDQDIPKADFWAVNDNLVVPQQITRCRRDGTIYFGGEPPLVRKYNSRFLRQFNTVITAQPVRHAGLIPVQQSLPWLVGWEYSRINGPGKPATAPLGYDDFKSMGYIEKPKLISVITSNKTMTTGHVQRLEFVAALQAHFGERLDVFGVGFNPVPDKWEALAPYQYHLSLENCSYPHYWTEKLADAYLAWSYPIYYGCPNLAEYFPSQTYTPIDINQPREAIEIIETAIQNPPSAVQIAALAEARRRVLDEYNLFAVIARLCQEKAKHPSRVVRKTMQNEVYFKRQRNFGEQLRRVGRYARRVLQ